MTKIQLTDALHAPYWKHPDPVVAEEIIRHSRSETGNVGRMSGMLFLCEAHPEKAEEWRHKYKFYFERAERYIHDYPLNGVGWNDYHMCRWLILGRDEDVAEIQQRATWGGEVGRLALWMQDSVADQIPEFREALKRFMKPTEAEALEDVISRTRELRAAGVSR